MFRECLIKKIEHVDSIVDFARSAISQAPEGKLLIERSCGRTKFYWRQNPHDKKGVYLGASDGEIKEQLAQKDYDSELLKVATREKLRLEKLLAAYDKGVSADKARGPERLDANYITDIFDRMSPEHKELVKPYILGDEEYVRRWLAAGESKGSPPISAGGFFSRGGTQVRSKSEVIIADALEAEGVPYRYEDSLAIGRYRTVRPDFKVLNKRTRKEYVWEHFGMMGNAAYCQDALEKLNDYAAAGYVLGDKLLLTQESDVVPLDTRVVMGIIERFLK